MATRTKKSLLVLRVVVLIFIISTIIITQQFVYELNSIINFTNKERDGIKYHLALFDLFKDLQEYRVTNLIGGEGTQNEPLDELQNRINNKFAYITQLDKTLDSLNHNEVIFAKLHLSISYLGTEHLNSSKIQAYAHTDDIMHQTMDFMKQIADKSNLILDPELATYYLMEINVNEIPYIAKNIGEARANIIKKITGNSESYFEEHIIVLNNLNNLTDNLERSATILLPSGKIPENFDNRNNSVTEKYKNFLEIINEAKNQPDYDVKKIYEASKESLNQYYALYSEIFSKMNELLSKRVHKKMYNVFLIEIFCLFIVISSIIFYLVFHRNLLALESTTNNLEIKIKDRTKELLNNELRLSAILSSAVDGIMTVDQKGIIESANKTIENIFGYTKNELIGESVNKLIPASYHQKHIHDVQTFFEKGKSRIMGAGREVKGLRKDGSIVPLEIGLSKTSFGDSQICVAIIRDITESKEIDRIKNEFVSVVSHELRTPLTSIRGSLGLVSGAMSKDLPEKTKQLINIAYKNSERLILLINDILDIDKIAAGKMRFDIKRENLDSLLHMAVESNQNYAKKFKVGIELDAVLPDITLYVDSNRFVQIMTNLISNAAKFSPEGGKVRIYVTSIDGKIRIHVHNDGPSIPEEFRPRIFTKFMQVDSSATRKKGGTGLGLYITKELTENMGGNIGFDSEDSKGTTFWIEFVDAGRTIVPMARLEYGSGNYRVLICEDDEDIVTILKMQIEKAGFSADAAYSMQEARHKLKNYNYIAMTLDLSLPEGNGLNFIRELRCNPETTNLPIVVVSAAADQAKKILNGNAFGVIDWLTKPLDESRLVESFKKVVANKGKVIPRILHVEDDKDLSCVLATSLGSEAELINAPSVHEAKKFLMEEDFSLIILDLVLPDGNGLSLLKYINDYHAGLPIPVLILSGNEISHEVQNCVAAAMVKSRMPETKIVETILSIIHYSQQEPIT